MTSAAVGWSASAICMTGPATARAEHSHLLHFQGLRRALTSRINGLIPWPPASATPSSRPGCSTFRAAQRGPRQLRTFSSLVFKLARAPAPGAAGRSVAALNGCSLRTGRRFSKAITWARARTQVPWSPQTWPSVRPVVPGAPTTGTNLLSWLAWTSGSSKIGPQSKGPPRLAALLVFIISHSLRR